MSGVGPVLESCDVTRSVIVALRELNPGVVVVDRGAYFRVVVPGRCVLTRTAVERVLGRPFRIPRDLELVMPSFAGRFRATEDEATWIEAAP